MRRAAWGRVASPRRDLRARSFHLAARIFRRFPDLASGDARHDHVARQLFRAATSVAAQLEEAAVYSSRRDLAHKLSLALREAREPHLWLRLVAEEPERADSIAWELQEANELVAILTTSIKRLKETPDTAP